MYRGIRAVADVAFFSVGAAILDSDCEVLCQQRRKKADIALFVGLRPFLFQRKNLGAVAGLLRRSHHRQAAEKSESQFRMPLRAHGPLLHNLELTPSALP